MIAILISGTVAMVVALLGTPLVISYFRQRGFGQMIREEGPEHHQAKAGTPTMGGTAIVLAALAGYLLGHVGSARFAPGGVLLTFTFVGMAAVGFADDFIKVRLQRNLGLNKTTKFVGQGVIAVLFATLGPTLAGLPRNVSVAGTIAVDIPTAAFIIWVFVLLSGTSNAVNLTDGLDGLAAGSGAMVFGAYTLIAFWQFRNPEAYGIDAAAALDAAILAAAVLAACLGFLWYNAPPAKIFMGDTGSLALGGLLAAISIMTGTQFLLVLLGGLYVVVTSSVIIQVFSYKVFGRRVFRMAPLHHHFELMGWKESTIIVRFWIVAAIGIALGLGAYYAEFLDRVGVSG